MTGLHLNWQKGLFQAIRSREFNLGILNIAAAYCHVWMPIYGACPLAEQLHISTDGKRTVERSWLLERGSKGGRGQRDMALQRRGKAVGACPLSKII